LFKSLDAKVSTHIVQLQRTLPLKPALAACAVRALNIQFINKFSTFSVLCRLSLVLILIN